MEILAIIEDRNKQLKAYLPAFVSPYMAESMPGKFYILAKTTLKVDREADRQLICDTCGSLIGMTNPGSLERVNVATDDDDYLVAAFDYKKLFDLYEAIGITPNLTWEDILGSYSIEQALHSYVALPIPAMACNLDGSCTAGKANFDHLTGEGDWEPRSGKTYLDFGVLYKRPWVYTLDHIPGIEVHIGSDKFPGIRDSVAFASRLTDLIVEKDTSTPVIFDKAIPVVNGLMYYPSVNGSELVIKTGAELFIGQPIASGNFRMPKKQYQYSSIMLIDFREFLAAGENETEPEPIGKFKLSDCTLRKVVDRGEYWEIYFSIPNGYRLDRVTPFISFDGRLMDRTKFRMLNANTICLTLTNLEIQYMRERDMQLTGNIPFNSNVIKLKNDVRDWIFIQFNKPTEDLIRTARETLMAEDTSWIDFSANTLGSDTQVCPFCGGTFDSESDITYPLADSTIPIHANCAVDAVATYNAQETRVLNYAMECLNSPAVSSAANSNRSFMFLVPGTDVYVHKFRVTSRLDYNSLLFNGNIGGLLQSTKGKELFEYVISDYMDYHILKNVDTSKPNLVIGSDQHLIGYAPYEFLTTLERDIDPPISGTDGPIQDIAYEAVPYINRYAPAVVGNDTNNFNLLDILAIE